MQTGKLVIELRGVEFHNKGAELMLYAILEKIRQEIPEVIFVMERRHSAPVSKQREVGVLTKSYIKKFGINWGVVGSFVPSFLRRKFGLILEKEINVVIDGSGFAFGDFWGAEKAGERMADHIERWSREGKKIIMLSQAFGSFENTALQNKMATILNNANLVFARDAYSYDFINAISSTKKNIFLRPDFTNLIKGIVPEYFDKNKFEIAIIPNNKLLESNVFTSREKYLDFLFNVAKILEEKHFKPFFLIHEGNKDLKLAEDVNKTFNSEIPILKVDDPLEVKGIIGNSKGVVTSRFHGLVSALAQSIPCLCVGWSHKYLALMEDYNYSEGLIKDEELTKEPLKNKLKLITEPELIEDIKGRLDLASAKQKELSQDMWKMVFNLIKS